MRNSNHSLWHRIVSSPVVMVVAIVALFFITRAAWNVHKGASIVSVELDQTQAELDRLKDQQNVLNSKISQLSTTEGIESELRTKYRATAEGESVAVIVDTEATTTKATSTPQIGWWGRFWNFLGL